MTRLGNAGTSRTNNFRVGTAREEFVAVITQTFGAMRAAFLHTVSNRVTKDNAQCMQPGMRVTAAIEGSKTYS